MIGKQGKGEKGNRGKWQKGERGKEEKGQGEKGKGATDVHYLTRWAKGPAGEFV